MTIYEKKTHSYSLEYYPPENKSAEYYCYAYVQTLCYSGKIKIQECLQPPSCSEAHVGLGRESWLKTEYDGSEHLPLAPALFYSLTRTILICGFLVREPNYNF